MSDQEPRFSTSDSALRFLSSSVGRAWLIAGGFGGLGGAAVWTFLVYVAEKSPDYATWVAALVVLTFLFAASYQQWSHQRGQISELDREKRELECRLEDRVDLALYEERQLLGNLHRLAAACTSPSEFIQGLEEQILGQLRDLYGFIRIGVYVPHSLLSNPGEYCLLAEPLRGQSANGNESVSFHFGLGKDFLAVGKGELDDVDTPKGVLIEGERNLAEEAFVNRTQQMKIHMDRAQRKFLIGGIPIANKEDDRIWGALIVYAVGTGEVDEIKFTAKLNSLRRTFVISEFVRAFEHVWETAQLRKAIDETNKGLRYQRLYAVLSVMDRPDGAIVVDTDYGFSLSPLERKDLLTVVENHKQLVVRALRGETNLVEYNERYSLCLIPLAEGERASQVRRILAVLDRGPFPIAEIESNWETLSHLIHHLCCGIRDPETSLHSQAAFRRHLSVILSNGQVTHSLGVFLIDVQAEAAQQEIKTKIAEALREWGAPFKANPLAMVSRYDGLCYALALPVESDRYAVAQAIGLINHIWQSLPNEIDLDELHIGVALIEMPHSCSVEEVLDVAFVAKERALLEGQEVWLERIDRATEDEVTRKKVEERL